MAADLGANLLIALITGAISAGGTIAALKVELRWLRRDVDETHRRLTVLEAARFGVAHVSTMEKAK
jgi:hypothetical protein